MNVQRWRKKPVKIEAMWICPETDPVMATLSANDMAIAAISGWMLGHGFNNFRVHGDIRPFSIAIDTLEGTMIASPGDYIIRGVGGEFYPCKPDIFKQTYEPIDA